MLSGIQGTPEFIFAITQQRQGQALTLIDMHDPIMTNIERSDAVLKLLIDSIADSDEEGIAISRTTLLNALSAIQGNLHQLAQMQNSILPVMMPKAIVSTVGGQT